MEQTAQCARFVTSCFYSHVSILNEEVAIGLQRKAGYGLTNAKLSPGGALRTRMGHVVPSSDMKMVCHTSDGAKPVDLPSRKRSRNCLLHHTTLEPTKIPTAGE